MTNGMEIQYLVSCEHGGNEIPSTYAELFRGYETLLNTHRGYDPGALIMAQELAEALRAPLVSSTTSRLLVELNRSPGHPKLFSTLVRNQPANVKAEILRDYYHPYREAVERHVADAVQQGRWVVHISSHSFTPELNGEVRNADVGLLYDPERQGELGLCLRWQHALCQARPELRIRRNYPYAGKSDGMCTFLRKRFSESQYLGIELEINQKHTLQPEADWAWLRETVIASLLLSLA